MKLNHLFSCLVLVAGLLIATPVLAEDIITETVRPVIDVVPQSGGTIIGDDPGGIIGVGGGPPIDTIINFIMIYIPPRAGQTERIISILKSIKA
ncbi:MAG: hypothetical protein Q7R81_05275 [Candidatus Peregrinibacteria bacterium]|nr:hypothetical protein [Candidatus Peregrinibacteria bacterium]